jgi:hypothetical protein
MHEKEGSAIQALEDCAEHGTFMITGKNAQWNLISRSKPRE